MNDKAPRQNFRLRITGGNISREEVENHLMLARKTSFQSRLINAGSVALEFPQARAIHEQKCKARQVSPSFIASYGLVQWFMARMGCL